MQRLQIRPLSTLVREIGRCTVFHGHPAPAVGRLADKSLEYSGEMRLRSKADRQRNTNDCFVTVEEKLLCARDPPPEQVFMRPDAGCGLELRREMHTRQTGLCCKI